MGCSRCGSGSGNLNFNSPTPANNIRPGTNQVPRTIRQEPQQRPVSEAVRNAITGLRYVPK